MSKDFNATTQTQTRFPCWPGDADPAPPHEILDPERDRAGFGSRAADIQRLEFAPDHMPDDTFDRGFRNQPRDQIAQRSPRDEQWQTTFVYANVRDGTGNNNPRAWL